MFFQDITKDQEQGNTPRMPAVTLDTLLEGKLWDRAKAHIEKSVADGTFKGEDLQKALKAGADLSGIDLSSLQAGQLDGLQLEGGNLSKARLPSMRSSSFKDVNLTAAQFFKCSLKNVSFDTCPLDHMRMQHSTLEEVNFTGKTSMNEADIFVSTAKSVRFSLGSMRGCKFFDSTLEDVRFNKQDMLGASIVTVKLKACDFRGADLRACDIVMGSVDEATQLKGAIISGRERMPENLNLQARGAVIGPVAGLREQVPEEAWNKFAARAGNAIPFLRQKIVELAEELSPESGQTLTIDGSGRSIIQIEQVPDQAANGRLPYFAHANIVRSRILGPGESGGLATGVEHSLVDLSPDRDGLMLPTDRSGALILQQDTKQHLDAIITTLAAQLTSLTAERLGEIAQRQETSDSRADSVVIAMGVSPARIYHDVFNAIDPQSHTTITETVFGKDSSMLSLAERQQKLVDYVDTFFDKANAPKISAEMKKFDSQVDRLWEQGTLVVISAGNDRQILKDFEGETPEATLTYSQTPELNLLARGKVVSVAASETAATPEIISDDIPAPFSSRGDGRHHPTISAGGQSVLIGYEIADGTSFSAPFAASVISLMRQINPDLSADQVRTILATTAYDNPDIEATTEGKGQMQVIKALRKAAELRR